MTTRRKLPYDVEVQLKASEIQIGAVEIKDSETDNRLTITTNGRALVSSQIENITPLKNKIRIMAWNGSNYELIEGYEGTKTLSYDANGNLSEITMKIIKDDGTEVTIKRTFTYDDEGNLTNISRWVLV